MLSDLMAVVCSVLDLCVKGLAVLHLSFRLSTLLQVTLFLIFFVRRPSYFSVVHRSDYKWIYALLPWDIVEERNVNDLKKCNFILQYLVNWVKTSQFLAAVSEEFWRKLAYLKIRKLQVWYPSLKMGKKGSWKTLYMPAKNSERNE